MGRPKKAATDGSDSLAKSKQSKRGQAPKQVQEAIERHRADEAVAAKEEKIQTLKNSLHKMTGAMCNEIENDIEQRFSPAFVKAMAEASYHFAGTVVRDVEAFRKHAKRATAMVDDVKLCARRNRSLHRAISDYADKLATPRNADKPSRSADAGPIPEADVAEDDDDVQFVT